MAKLLLFVSLAAHTSFGRPIGQSVGLMDKVWVSSRWRCPGRGISGLCWSQVLPELIEVSRALRSLLVRVIHAVGNDLCFFKMSDLLTLMRADLEFFPGFFWDLVIVWSEIITRTTGGKGCRGGIEGL